ncbi:MAG: pectinesterase family protein [Acetatifactor sp.]
MLSHSKKHRTLHRIFACVLSLAMLFSNISMGYVQASNADEGDLASAAVSPETFAAGETTQFDQGKIDVWDFGAQELDTNTYNNKLTAEVINGWYEGVEAGTAGKNLASFTTADGELAFNDGGYPTTHRLRTTNENLTRYDAKSLTGEDGTVYGGYIYSNKGSNAAVYLSVKAYAGDRIHVVAGSNGGNSLINFEGPDGTVEDAKEYVAGGANAKILTFYPKQTGMYKLYSTTEKLVIARVYREHSQNVAVSGAVSAPSDLSGYSIVFKNTANGMETEAPVTNGTYAANLYASYTYEVSLKDANGYIIVGDSQLTLAKEDTAKDFPITVSSVRLHTITGNITGLSGEALAALQLSFKSDEIYVPEVTINGATYSAVVETDVEYDVVAEGVNDYSLTSSAKVSYSADTAEDITFAEKPRYAVTIAPEGATAADLANATFTFTNLNEEGYVYTFTGTEGIALRDGVYAVKVSDSGIFVQKLTSNVKVEGAAVTKTIAFDSDITSWNFSDAGFAEAAASGSWNGLRFSNGNVNKTYLLSGAGTVSVPVKGSCQIKVSACYQYSFYFESDTEASVGVKTGSTGQIDTFTYDYTGAAGTVDITVLGTSYFTKIEVAEVTPYTDTITVGATGCDYTTINAALDAVRAMNRTADQRVTIAIQPGNYEEMLVIDVPNVTLKNASSAPSIELKNKGVDIDANAVRITSYYGHGYAYYSMGSDCKWNEEILKVNKENGYLSFENPGTGTTSGSYWNATVVVGASGFEAEGIIFENSFNQYVSAKAADDVIVPLGGAKEPASAPRASLAQGSTAVQDKAYVERAAALAIMDNCTKVSFDNCKFIGRQDTLYGGKNSVAAFYDCAVYGGTDYIFGGMTAVFAKCDLVFNTSEDKNDVGYITAAQQTAGRGYLMYNCNITSTTPGVDTASEYTSKPGYLGRPWQANTSEVVFFKTVIDAADTNWYEVSPSLIRPEGWLSTLGGQSALSVEYGTYEMAKDVDNSAARASWAGVLSDEQLADGSAITVETFLGDWDAFAGKDMTIVMPTDKVDNSPKEEDPVEKVTYVLDVTTDLESVKQGSKADGDTQKAGTEDYFTVIYSAKTKVDGSDKVFDDGYTASRRINMGAKTGFGDIVTNAVMFETQNPATVKIWWVSGGDTREMALFDNSGAVVTKTAEGSVKNSLYISALTLDAAGKYFLGSEEGSNYIFKVEVTEEAAAAAEPVVNTLDTTADLKAFAQGSKADGDTEQAGTNEYFTLIYSVKTKVDGSNKSFDDGYNATQRVNFGGVVSKEKNAIKFTTNSKATVKVWWAEGGDDKRQIAILNSDGTEVASTNEDLAKNAPCISTLELTEAGTYYLGSKVNNNYIFKVEVTEDGGSSVKPDRADWSKVAAPVITNVADGEAAGTIDVTVAANVGYDGADEVVITMYDAEGNEIASLKSIAEKTEHTRTFTPGASGTYYFAATISREGEADKVTAEKKYFDFVLPLDTPDVSSATCLGNGKVSIAWGAVAEAEKYIVSAVGTDISVETDQLTATLEGLTVGQTYTFSVVAVRGNETSKAGTIEWEVVDEAQRTWSFAAFGSSVNTADNKATGSVYDNNLVVQSVNGKGKLVPASTDGLAFYYTTIDPETENFTLSADITVDQWTYSNGQEGFGMMAADAVGKNGDASTFWNNSYMASVTKVEYLWSSALNAVVDAGGSKYTMKLGIGAQAKTGVTAADVASGAAMPANFLSKMYPLELSAAKNVLDAGTYNIVGNYTKDTGSVDIPALKTTFHVEIQRNNTGYFVSYTDEAGNTTTQKFYHADDGDELTRIDSEHIYAGFFASRNAKISVKNVQLTTIHPDQDAPAEERPVTKVTPVYSIESAKIATSADYELVYYGNADGTLTITGPQGTIADAVKVNAFTKHRIRTKLDTGANTFQVTFTPDADYKPSEYEVLESYDTAKFDFTVNYQTNKGDIIYVSPNGKDLAPGTKEAPMSIYNAVAYAAPGQKILLMEGTYELSKTITINRGINGTASQMIYLMADPEATGRPVLDFNGKCAGMVVAGDYWYLQGFDVTGSANGQKGLQLSGDNCTVDRVNAYRNGNTGIQISRYLSTDTWEDWPSNNLILNCTSYLNADAGYEDADGFAAKLTVADGNVFDGCIAAYNADDGWDLFAKVESGPIGKVVIRNCIAFKNGYDIDANGNEINAGNGNGFKMGGSSISGHHLLENSIAFANKAKGIDSNSCPDIQAVNSTTFNNGSYNVAFYTNDAANTDFSADGVLSYKKDSNNTAEQFKLKGTQDQNKVYKDSNYYYDGADSKNKSGAAVAADWFVSLDTDAAIHGGITRNADGTINMNGYLELTDKAASDTGARMSGTASGDPEVRTALEIVKLATAELSALGVGDITGANRAIAKVLALQDSVWEEAVIDTEFTAALEALDAELKRVYDSSLTIEVEDARLNLLSQVNVILSVPAGQEGTLKITPISMPDRKPDEFMNSQLVNVIAFDISLYDELGNSIQLVSPIILKLTLPEGITSGKRMVVLHYTGDNIEIIDPVLYGNTLIFTTTSLSPFVLANVETGTSGGGSGSSSGSGSGSGSGTGSTGGGSGSGASGGSNSDPANPSSPKTYDDSEWEKTEDAAGQQETGTEKEGSTDTGVTDTEDKPILLISQPSNNQVSMWLWLVIIVVLSVLGVSLVVISRKYFKE